MCVCLCVCVGVCGVKTTDFNIYSVSLYGAELLLLAVNFQLIFLGFTDTEQYLQ